MSADASRAGNQSKSAFHLPLRAVWIVGGQFSSYSELMGLPKEFMSDTFFFPTYNNTWMPLNSQSRFGGRRRKAGFMI